MRELRGSESRPTHVGETCVNTAGGRIWFCIDDEVTTVWMAGASVGHPESTE
jgi:hypothetical protein